MQQKIPVTSYARFSYPPGGILIWIIVLLELITFGIGLIGFFYVGGEHKEMFHQASTHLSPLWGAINTMVLLTAGFFMVKSSHNFKAKDFPKTISWMSLAMIGGLLFMAIKGVEYYSKIQAGISLNENLFFNFYWALTFFHLIHVLVALVILMVFYIKLKRNPSSLDELDFMAGAAFWHMCDLIWLFIFPALYLVY
ncbi:MAG: cytochrome c oxidase subunit 3 [Bacteroidales bacterium]|jgi:nitric oxide reductase NorE protein|nr:cytochrome c oxidase subunit 3 [Bacteroidales bacterium]MDD3702187.1 cytochrome c oxidase subunit 3 [Bacteroidales bacterium]MDY0368939.1 cytochrome c oxidase subunit 3 [Bacteroidales bacterium]